MRKAENVNAPWLGGWILGVAAGLVAFGVLVVIGKFDLFPAAALAAVVAALAGMVLGMPWGGGKVSTFDRKPVVVTPKATAVAAPVAAPAMAQPAAFVSAPVAEAAAVMTKAKAEKAKAEGPERLKAPRKGKADDLKEIEGIGPAMEKLVNELGFYHFAQLADWSDDDVEWVDANMKTFKGRIVRDKWVAQAKIIVSEGLEAFRERAKTNNY
jgi:predicted flap endonuclease-1-like 5' DNA nuclease